MAGSIHAAETTVNRLPLQNLGSLAQAYNRGNTHLPG
jgi:hypothetical protein